MNMKTEHLIKPGLFLELRVNILLIFIGTIFSFKAHLYVLKSPETN